MPTRAQFSSIGVVMMVAALVTATVERASAQVIGADHAPIPVVGDFLPDQAGLLREQIVGTWMLISFYEEDDSGEEIEKFGLRPPGHLVFDRQGHFAFQIEDDLGFNRCVAYSGTYEIETKSRIRFRPDSPVSPNNERHSDLRLDSAQMELTSTIYPSLAGSSYSHTIWQRVTYGANNPAMRCPR